jgi:hypothetical protein
MKLKRKQNLKASLKIEKIKMKERDMTRIVEKSNQEVKFEN